MTATCQAWSTRYVGRKAERKTYEGPCVLEAGHDLDHLPASLAAEQSEARVWNAALDACLAIVRNESVRSLSEAIEALRR